MKMPYFHSSAHFISSIYIGFQLFMRVGTLGKRLAAKQRT